MLNKKKTTLYLFLLLAVFTSATLSCRKEQFLETGGELQFSVDTLIFDTVFSSLGSFTAQIKVYNPQDQKVTISSIRLEGGTNSEYNLNVNGQASNVVNDIEVAANDSIYVFATVNIDPDPNTNNPFVVEDKLIATLNGKDFTIPFIAYGQNAYYLVDSLIVADQTWKTDKPYVIINNAAVDENVTLTIPAGCRVYVHADSRLLVLGTLKVNGTKQDSVVFQGDRLDRKYFGNEGYPGEWGGLYFTSTSRNSEINYAILKNCGNSTRLGESSFTPAAIQLNYDTIGTSGGANFYQLRLRNTIIENSIGYGILSFGSTLFAENCLINTCGAQCLASFEGGRYDLNNCTFATYGTDKINHTDNPVMALLNYRDINNTSYVAGPLFCELNNCVVWGSLETEFVALARGNNSIDDTFSVVLNNCLIKNKDGVPEGVIANNTIVNEDPLFKDYTTWDFRPSESSPLINAGTNQSTQTFVPPTTDLDGKMRGQQIDIGCYEY